MNSEHHKVLGLFPYFGPEAVGGVQASARIAWSAVTDFVDGPATLVSYAGNDRFDKALSNRQSLIVGSKLEAIHKALSGSWSPDVVFVWHLGLLRLLPFFRFSRVRVVLMLLGIEAWKKQGWLTRRQMKQVDLFLSISDHTWRNFIKFNPRYVHKAHQTVRLGLGTPAPDETPPPTERPVALMLSRLSKDEDYKGHCEVINAWSSVLRRRPEAELWIAGDGDLRSDLQQLAIERGLEDKIRFWGHVSEERKQELLRQCCCLVMPSRAEGFGLVYLEAMRLGRPCLVSTLDAGREVVNPPEAGLAANPDSEAELADALCRLLTDGPEWQHWSAQARRRYEENYTGRHFQERLLAALFPDQFLADPFLNRAERESSPSEFAHV
jgi:glycosyltransferase involved in cell wall biosynthesis